MRPKKESVLLAGLWGAVVTAVSVAQPIGYYGLAFPVNPAALETALMPVHAGTTYAIVMRGVYSYTSALEIGNPSVWLPPGGNGQLGHAGPVPSLPFGCVYARIDDGPPFLIGARRTFVAEHSGQLRFFINDNNTSDNVGTLVAFLYPPDPTAEVTAPSLTTMSGILVFPNPTAEGVSLVWAAAPKGATQFQIYDSGGREVRTVESSGIQQGDTVFHWDGRDAAGREVPGGTYHVRARAGSGTRTASFRVIR